MRLLIFGGTTEGRILAERASAMGAEVTVSVTTDLGAEALSAISGLTVLVGPKDRAALRRLLPRFDLCVDATHPYAASITASLRAVARETGTPLRRLLRPAGETEDAVRVIGCAQAADFLAAREGNILLTTGAKELSAFAALDKGRLFARVLPTHESLAACEALGLPHRNILALQGPFTQAMNEAMLAQYRIAWLVTKDGGGPGGFAEKLAAAQSAGARVVLVERPADDGGEMDDILREVGEALS